MLIVKGQVPLVSVLEVLKLDNTPYQQHSEGRLKQESSMASNLGGNFHKQRRFAWAQVSL